MKMGAENYIFGSENRSGFGEPDTFTKNSREYPPSPLGVSFSGFFGDMCYLKK